MELDLADCGRQHQPSRVPWCCAGQAAGTRRIRRPITAGQVRRIAHEGDTLDEPIEVVRLRNRRITLAYSDLSERLADLIAGPDARRDANWCTFATWSSRTIGLWIRDDVRNPAVGRRGVPRRARRLLNRVTRYLAGRGGGASYRTLAAGNRIVFREIGLVIALFIEAFGEVDRGRPDPRAWAAYREQVEQVVAEVGQLDASWLPTDPPDPELLRLGLRRYYDALFASDPKERAELVLAGSLLLAAYEQRRVDAYTAVVLALFTDRATGRLVRCRTGTVDGWFRRLPSRLFSWLATRCLVLRTPDERLWIGRPLSPPPGPPGAALFPTDLQAIASPGLQALLARYDRSGGLARRRRMRDWTSYDERMTYITNLLRSRQQHAGLFAPPFAPAAERALLDGTVRARRAGRDPDQAGRATVTPTALAAASARPSGASTGGPCLLGRDGPGHGQPDPGAGPARGERAVRAPGAARVERDHAAVPSQVRDLRLAPASPAPPRSRGRSAGVARRWAPQPGQARPDGGEAGGGDGEREPEPAAAEQGQQRGQRLLAGVMGQGHGQLLKQ